MVYIDCNVKGKDKTLCIAEGREDFLGFNIIGIMPIEDKPKAMIAIVHRMCGNNSEIKPVVISESLFHELDINGFNLGVEIVV
jgi:hypothetical protein